jgi:hypothetical protein
VHLIELGDVGPAEKALALAPRRIRTLTSGFAPASPTSRGIARHISALSALRLSGRFRTSSAIAPRVAR